MLTIKRISQELRGTLKRVIDGSSLRSFYGIRGKRQSTRRPVDLQRGTTMFASTVRSLCINSLLPHCCPSSCPCTPYAHAYVRLCPCILINTLLTPRPRHINHETMENAVGGGPTGVDLSIPLSCIPLPPSLSCTLDVCHVRHPWQQWGISLSLSNSNSCMRAISPRKVSTSIYCEISRERARLYRAKRLPVEEPAVVDRQEGILTLRWFHGI